MSPVNPVSRQADRLTSSPRWSTKPPKFESRRSPTISRSRSRLRATSVGCPRRTTASTSPCVFFPIVAKQLDAFLSEEFMRQREIEASSLRWLMLHAELEAEHADASTELARLIPAESRHPALRGGHELYRLGWAFLDEIHALCHGEDVLTASVAS